MDNMVITYLIILIDIYNCIFKDLFDDYYSINKYYSSPNLKTNITIDNSVNISFSK